MAARPRAATGSRAHPSAPAPPNPRPLRRLGARLVATGFNRWRAANPTPFLFHVPSPGGVPDLSPAHRTPPPATPECERTGQEDLRAFCLSAPKVRPSQSPGHRPGYARPPHTRSLLPSSRAPKGRQTHRLPAPHLAGDGGEAAGESGGAGPAVGEVGVGARRVRGAAPRRRWDMKSTELGPERPTSVARKIGANCRDTEGGHAVEQE